MLYGREDLRVETVAVPVAGTGELVLRVGAALTCGTDLKVYRRGYHAAMLVPPCLFGHEFAGTVVDSGQGAGFAVGERVVALNSAPCGVCYFCRKGQPNLCSDLLFNNGAYAEYVRVPARIVEKNTLRVPDGMLLEHAALTEPLACVVNGMEQTGAVAGDTVVVVGAGPIGLMFLAVARSVGCRVIAVVKRADQVDNALRFGADEVVRIGNGVDTVAAVRSLTENGVGADAVVECVATPQSWEEAVAMVRKGGVVNLFGGPPSGTVVQFDTNRLHYGGITLKASFHHTARSMPQGIRAASGRRGAGRELYYGAGRSGGCAGGVWAHDGAECGRCAGHKDSDFAGGRDRARAREFAGSCVAAGRCSATGGCGVMAVEQNRLEGAPAGLLEPEVRPSAEEALLWCKALATSHYENFHVATSLLPKRLRAHFYAVYAYCRVSDDLGDEVADRAVASRLLATWRGMLDECFDAPDLSRHPVFVALRPSIVACDLPREPFVALVRAISAGPGKDAVRLNGGAGGRTARTAQTRWVDWC